MNSNLSFFLPINFFTFGKTNLDQERIAQMQNVNQKRISQCLILQKAKPLLIRVAHQMLQFFLYDFKEHPNGTNKLSPKKGNSDTDNLAKK